MVNGLSFCFTGSMSQSRRKVESLARKNGARVSHKVTSATDYLVAGGCITGSAKARDAKKLGVVQITEREFMAMI